jgi:bifunctional non-homologous end joining protein LigD
LRDVSEDERGVPHFSDLQDDLKSGCRDRLRYHVFDLLYSDGLDLPGATLLDRKIMLARLVTPFATTEGDIAAFVGHATQSLSRPGFA